jgi:DNA mismatch repair ATPase MutS
MRTGAAMRHLAAPELSSPKLRQAQADLAHGGAGAADLAHGGAGAANLAHGGGRAASLVQGGGAAAHAALAQLESRIGLADARHSAPLHFVLQVLTLWDFHTLFLLERWQATAGRRARRWLGALGEVEALAALAVLRHENPGWVMPEVASGEPALQAEGLGHPLLPAAGRVGNGVTVGPAGSFLLVTGSNMSGKSTLLRAIGLNVILAQAGGPACAAALRLPPVLLATSVLVEDSLAGGISFFLAELLRIREVVAAADTADREGVTLLYLLDEVLRGTNSAERQIAVRRVLRHLLARGALGAVSTHDLELAAGAGAPDIAAAARTVHFAETLEAGPEGPRMTFDYRLRPGPASTTNALLLLRQVGLDLPEVPDSQGG